MDMLSLFKEYNGFIITACVKFALMSIPSKRKKTAGGDVKVSAENLLEKDDSYQRKTFLTPTERQFKSKLTEILSNKYEVHCCVRLADIVEPSSVDKRNSREYNALFRQVSQWHCDFVIVERVTLNIITCIELDDPSHQRDDRKRRDSIMNKVMSAADVPLIRFNSISQLEQYNADMLVEKR